MPTYPFESALQGRTIARANANGNGVVNDGTRYIISAYMDFNEHCATVHVREKGLANQHIGWFQDMPDVVKIIVQKGDQACAWHRREDDSWYRNVAQ